MGSTSKQRVLLGAFGDPGHTFPLIALGKELLKRGHVVTLQTWDRWQTDIEALGMQFAAAPEYKVFPTRETPLKPYEAVVRAATDTLPLVEEFQPDVVVADVLTLAPALAAELVGVPVATVIPHIYPNPTPEYPPFSFGARAPKTALGKTFWRLGSKLTQRGLRIGRDELNGTRRRLGLPPVNRLFGGISEQLCLVATLPQLEYPRVWPDNTKVIGPLMWEPQSESVKIRAGEEPLVLIAPSTAQDPDFHLLQAALEGLADLPVRVIATSNRPLERKVDVPPNAQLVEWLPYSQVMPHCDLVIAHGGHGTVCRALSFGVPLLLCPAGGDMYENAARIAWAGLGARIPHRGLSPKAISLGARTVLLDSSFRDRARAVQYWLERNEPATSAAEGVEALALSQARTPV